MSLYRHCLRPLIRTPTYAADGRCRVWDLHTGECRHEIAWDCGGVTLRMCQRRCGRAADHLFVAT